MITGEKGSDFIDSILDLQYYWNGLEAVKNC